MNIKQILILVAVTLMPIMMGNTGCQTTDNYIKVDHNVVVMPDRAIYVCPEIGELPDPNTLKDTQVSKLIITLYKNNKQCKRSIDGVFDYLDQAKIEIENPELRDLSKNRNK